MLCYVLTTKNGITEKIKNGRLVSGFQIPEFNNLSAEERDELVSLKIPNTQPPNSEVEYTIHPGVGKLEAVMVVPASRPPDVGSSPTFRDDHFDLSVPRQISSYDKFGGKVMAHAIKRYVFGNAKTRLTRERCEEFFNDDKNFA